MNANACAARRRDRQCRLSRILPAPPRRDGRASRLVPAFDRNDIAFWRRSRRQHCTRNASSRRASRTSRISTARIAWSSGLSRTLIEGGTPAEKVVLAGFSQGACLAADYAARHPRRYGGIIAFSGGLIGDRVEARDFSGDLEGTPAFIGSSDVDPHIPVERVRATAEILKALGAEVTLRLYPGMGHMINQDEMEAAAAILERAAG
jgi:predicted esterase